MTQPTTAVIAPSPKTAPDPTVLYRNPPRTFATTAVAPNAVVWKRPWPVAWSSGGRMAAIVRTTPTVMLA